ncbi:hypothetical protein CQW23_07602 [Capsicum baccatum]|uniref:Uncharacterized protein n=1 Tax=Capsicum baccatum TaxID=33114 RepID=A0A2G2X6P9_CAPBA|nr:hypothetical protein CQW23_07602 [Capsicum baccatum]
MVEISYFKLHRAISQPKKAIHSTKSLASSSSSSMNIRVPSSMVEISYCKLHKAVSHPKKAICSTKLLAYSSSSSITSQKNGSIRFHCKKSNVTSSCKLDFRKSPDEKAKHTVSQASSLKVACEEQNCQNLRVQDSMYIFSCGSSSSEVIPLFEDYNDNMDVPDENINEDAPFSHTEYENFYFVHKQLLQIENQQSSLLDLLQGFNGSSRRKERIARDDETAGFCHVSRLNGASFTNWMQHQT